MIKYNSHGDGASDLPESPNEMESLPLDEPPPPSYDSSTLHRNPSPSDFLRVWVSEPRKEYEQPSRAVFYTYLITTSTNVAEFGESEFCVRRRFRDVVALSERLSETKRGFFVPVRPEKGVVAQSEEFLERRRAELEKYLNRLAAHPEIRRSEELMAFLGAEIGESSATEAVAAEGRGGSAELVRALKGMRQLVANDWGRVKPVVLEGDKGFLEKKEWLSEFENRLCNLSQQAESLVKSQQDMGETMSDLGFAFLKFSMFETEEAVLDSQIVRASDMKYVATAAIKSGRLYQELNKKTVKHLDVLHDYLMVVLAANNAFSDRSSALLAVQNLSSELSSLKSRIDRLEASSSKIFGGERSRMRKIGELKETLRLTEDAKSCAVSEYKQIKEKNRSEFERFDKERRNDFMSMLRGFVLNEALYAEKMANVWEVLADVTSEHVRDWS